MFSIKIIKRNKIIEVRFFNYFNCLNSKVMVSAEASLKKSHFGGVQTGENIEND